MLREQHCLRMFSFNDSKLLTFRMELLGRFFFVILGSILLLEFRSSKVLLFPGNNGEKSTPKRQHLLSHTSPRTIEPVIPSLIRRPSDVTWLNKAWDTSLNFSLQHYKDIHVETFQTAYFMSVFEFQGWIYTSYRTSLVSWKTNVARLDSEFHPINSEFKQILRLEDARIFEFEGDIWFVDNRCCSRQRVLYSMKGKKLHLNKKKLGSDFFWGKNWSPAVVNMKVYFIYSLQPLQIIHVNMKSGNLIWYFRERTLRFGPDIQVRGGTNALVLGEYIYGVGRISHFGSFTGCGGTWKSNHFPILWRISLFNFTAKSNFLGTELHELNSPFISGVNDPTSLTVVRQTLLVAMSSCECDCSMNFETSGQKQNNSLYQILIS